MITDSRLTIVGGGRQRQLVVIAERPSEIVGFEGDVSPHGDGVMLRGPLSAANAEAARKMRPSLRPQPLGLALSAGTGDRLGVATAGHARAFRSHGAGVRAVFAQQSAREMERLGRSPREVLDDATFGCLEAGWEGPVGADADHLKSIADINRCAEAGFTSFTLDPGDEVRAVTDVPSDRDLAALPWARLEDTYASLLKRYARLRVDVGDRVEHLTEPQVRRAAVKYGAAIAHAAEMYHHLAGSARGAFEAEIAVDEAGAITSPADHIFLATELRRLGVSWNGFAPRFAGTFEKGVEYIGDRREFEQSVIEHARIARALGPYKLSLHSGSDKFSIYEFVVEATRGLVHLKTSGTSYLVGLEVAATYDPDLFRRLYETSREAYRSARSSYHVSADIAQTPDPDEVAAQDLSTLVKDFHCRQILHVGYGAVLATADGGESSELSTSLRELLGERSEEYAAALELHIGRHLNPFSSWIRRA